MSFQMSTMGTGSFAKAMGTGSAVDDAGVSLPRPQSPAERDETSVQPARQSSSSQLAGDER